MLRKDRVGLFAVLTSPESELRAHFHLGEQRGPLVFGLLARSEERESERGRGSRK